MTTYALEVLGTLADLRAKSGVAGDVRRVLGYHAPRDGGGGEFVWEPDTQTADDGGLVVVADEPNGRTGCWRRVLDAPGVVHVRWFGARGDGATLDHVAFAAAVRALPNALPPWGMGNLAAFAGPTIRLGAGRFKLGATWLIDRQCTVEGLSTPYEAAITQLACAHPGVGIEATKGAIITGVWIAPYVKGDAAQHGILATARTIVRQSTVSSFGGDGVRLAASTADVPPTNASGSLVEECTLQLNGGNGVTIAGGDANACRVVHNVISDNGGWGADDQGFLGNRLPDNLYHNNAAGAFRTTNENARSLHDGAYVEGDAGAVVRVDSPSMVLGGFGASSNTGTGFTLHGAGGGTVNHLTAVNNLDPARQAVARLGSLSAPGVALELGALGLDPATGLVAWSELLYRLGYRRHLPDGQTLWPQWEWTWGGQAGAPLAMTGGGHPYGNSRLLMQLGQYLGPSTFERLLTTTNGPPQFAAPQGSLAIEVLPVPGGPALWTRDATGWRVCARCDP